MVRITSKLAGFLGLFFIFLAAIVSMPQSASAAAGNPSYCDADIDRIVNTNIGTEVPVVLVHGFNGSSADWGSLDNANSFASKINVIPGVAVAHMFNYNTLNWVDHQNSGPKLAKTIDCISRLSLQSGGKGKVSVVGYSMGGLVARDALSHRSSDGQRAIADQVGQAITIGTPHIGTTLPTAWQFVPFTLVSAFTTGSNELTRLPHFPSQTAVHTIAGDVEKVYKNNWNQEVKRERPYDDTLVTTLSAHAEYTIDAVKGGGQATFECEKEYRSFTSFAWYISVTNAPCQHDQLTKNANNGVRGDTVDAIQKYVSYLNAPTTRSLTIRDLTTTYDSRWTNVAYGPSGPGEDLDATDTTNGAECTNCSTTPPPVQHAFIQIFNTASFCTTQIQDCLDLAVVGDAPAVTVGGRTPDYSIRYLEGGNSGTALMWCFNDEKVCMSYRRPSTAQQVEPSQALLDVLNTATWANP